MKVKKLVLEQIINNGKYMYIGFMISQLPTSAKKVIKEAVLDKEGNEVEEEEVEIISTKGRAYIVFKKDNTLYYVESHDISRNEESESWAYGNFQPYIAPQYIQGVFHITVENDIVDIVPLTVENPIG